MKEICTGLLSLVMIGIGVVVLFVLLPSPSPSLPDPFASLPENDIRVITHNLDWKVIEIEGCEYFYQKSKGWKEPGGITLCHKGNCKNPIHMYNVRMEK
jgi:hypothetical protein